MSGSVACGRTSRKRFATCSALSATPWIPTGPSFATCVGRDRHAAPSLRTTGNGTPSQNCKSTDLGLYGTAATGEIGMQRFIHRLNIEHYEKLLQTVTAEAERKRILRLLEEEKRSSIWTARQREREGGHSPLHIACKRGQAPD
jgi:hypothetical protein